MEEKKKEVRLITCRECDRTQAFELPDKGQTVDVKCRECGSEIVKVTRDDKGALTTDPPDMELIQL